jgi:hypothetical protein
MRASCARPQYDLARDRGAATLALLSFAMLIVSLDQYIVIVALPDIGRELGYSSQTLQSVISAYAVDRVDFSSLVVAPQTCLDDAGCWSPASLYTRDPRSPARSRRALRFS